MPIERLTGVLCAGNISFDILMRPVDRLEWGTSTWVEDYVEDMGGNGSNTSFTLAMLGVPVRLHGMVGRDDYGERLLERLRAGGVDLSAVTRSQAPTTATICVVNSAGNRLFLQRLGSSAEAFAEPAEFDSRLVGNHSHYHLANLFALPHMKPRAAEVLRRAREAGLTTSIDTGWDQEGRWIETLRPCLPLCDLLFVNEEEARQLTGKTEPGQIADSLRQHGAHDVVVKLGAEGCAVFWGREDFREPAFRVEVVDTTGAGDCFAGAFLAALHRGGSYRQAARLANAVGAMVVEQLGAVRGVRSYEQVTAWISSQECVET